MQDELTQVDTHVAATGRRLSRWLALVLLLAVIVLGAVGSIRWLQQKEHERAEVVRMAEEAERLAQQQARERQDREREQQVAERRKQDEERKAAEEARQQAQKIVQVEQEFADRFLLQLITNNESPRKTHGSGHCRNFPHWSSCRLKRFEG